MKAGQASIEVGQPPSRVAYGQIGDTRRQINDYLRSARALARDERHRLPSRFCRRRAQPASPPA